MFICIGSSMYLYFSTDYDTNTFAVVDPIIASADKSLSEGANRNFQIQKSQKK